MAGLARICKLYGRMKINGCVFVWDYARDIAVPEREMTSAQKTASEKARAESLRQQFHSDLAEMHAKVSWDSKK